ncbi:MAG: prolyl oligopeptidase family serine peptidase [Chitinivibrionales bacterium]|nr:prolyl oligopeptidase family serine peptidase [Chitinivibrionales bacterium]
MPLSILPVPGSKEPAMKYDTFLIAFCSSVVIILAPQRGGAELTMDNAIVGDTIDPSRSGIFYFTSELRKQTMGIAYAVPSNLPRTMDKPRRVVYYLHGLPSTEQNEGNFSPRPDEPMLGVLKSEVTGPLGLTSYDDVQELVDALDVIIVCCNGGRGWWIDSPEKPEMANRSCIVKELIPYIDKHLPTIDDRNGRILIGTSMGGFGALHIGFSHPDVFGAVASMIGAIEPTREYIYSEKNYSGWNLRNLMGEPDNTKRWRSILPLYLAEKLTEPYPHIFFLYGWDDALAFGKGAENLHQKLKELEIPHDVRANTKGHQAGGGGQYVPSIIAWAIGKLNGDVSDKYDGYADGEYVMPDKGGEGL